MAQPKWLFLAQIVSAVLILGTNGQAPSVTLDGLGELIGKEMTTINGRTIHAFQGIPYGESTAGENRYQAPIPRKWRGVLDATQPGFACLQPDFGIKDKTNRYDLIGSEDCLNLQVYTPDLDHNQNLPVLVYFHGGGFLNGDEKDFRPDHLLDRDVILVVPHYRLGVLGFLSMQNDLVPGNAGLLDSVEALRWIQEHISKFGGDPNRVTVSGQSTGSTLAQYMMITPLTDGLVHGAIMMSGSTLTGLSYDKNPVQSARDIASFANCVGTDEQVTLCLAYMDANFIIDAHIDYYSAGGTGGIQPVISRPDEPEATRVVPDDPKVIVQTGNHKAVPMLAGATRHDGMFYANTLDTILKLLGLNGNEFFIRKKLARTVVEFAGIVDTTGSISDMMDSKYLSYVTPEQRGNYSALIPGLLDFLTVEYMKAPAQRMVQINSERADSYLYTFNYRGRYHLNGNGINTPPSLFEDGVPHSDDMIYLTPRIPDPGFNSEELDMVNTLTTLWSNFATSGNPNLPVEIGLPQWPKYDMQDEFYYEIDRACVAKNDYSEQFFAAIFDDLPYSSSGKGK